MENIKNLRQRSRIKVQIFRAIILALIPLIPLACKKTDSESKVTLDSDETHYPGFQVSDISGNTSENGGIATFTLKPHLQPDGDVVVDLSCSDNSEGSLDRSMVTFDSTNWNIAQTIRISGENDDVADGNQDYSIQLSVNSSNTQDTRGYSDLQNFASLPVTNTDDDTAGYTISSIRGNTGEDLTTATFSLSLNSQPDGDVVIDLSSSDNTEGSVTSTPLTFTSLNWSDDQTVDVRGVNDFEDDGNQNYTIQLTINRELTDDSSGYASLDPGDVPVINVDDDTIGFNVSPISGNTGEDLSTATFTVRLNTEPNDNVVIDMSSDNSSEGTVTSTPLTFTTDNWSVDQTVEVTGVDDNLDDGNQSYSIQLTINGSTEDTTGYADLNPDDVSVINVDNDTLGVNISQTGRFTNESGTSVDFSVSLDSQPYDDVRIPLSSSNTDEGSLLVNSLTFTPEDWDTSQDVTVKGVNDSSFDTAQLYTILLSAASSSDSSYDGYDPADLTLYNLDDEYKLPYTGTSGEDSDILINHLSYTYSDTSPDDVTVTDNNTGLIWQRRDDDIPRTWAEAGTYCEELELDSQTDWRLPDIKELARIINYENKDPAIDNTAFPGTNSSLYWSSTINAKHTTNDPWRIDFGFGQVLKRYNSGDSYVRCVRSGQVSTSTFADLGDQTVLERKTGLVWQQEDDNSTRDWEAAISFCDGLNLAGNIDWRLPNVKELESIIDHNKFSPAIDNTAFPGTSSSCYWSSTINVKDTSYVWLGKFKNGEIDDDQKTTNCYVRCVRFGQ